MVTAFASDCYFCRTNTHLMFKTFNEIVWWVHCDGCGERGLARSTKSEAGKAWNEQVKGVTSIDGSSSECLRPK